MIQSYMERQLGSLHDASAPSVASYKDKVISFLIGVLAIVLLPYLHIGEFEFFMSLSKGSCYKPQEIERSFVDF